jgi:hypothetical protein
MATNVDHIIRKLRPPQRKKIEARAAQLIAEEMSLRELRHARKLTHIRMAKTFPTARRCPVRHCRRPSGPKPQVEKTRTLRGTLRGFVGSGHRVRGRQPS